MVDAIFLPSKEAQGKVRQSQGRAASNNFANARKLILGSIGTPLNHLSVKATGVAETYKVTCFTWFRFEKLLFTML